MRIRDPKRIGGELRAWLKKKGLTEAELAAKIMNENKSIGLSQSWISRILNGQFRRLTPAVRLVTQYANIRVHEDAAVDRAGADIIEKAISDAWDGSLPHANLIARLIRVAQGFSR